MTYLTNPDYLGPRTGIIRIAIAAGICTNVVTKKCFQTRYLISGLQIHKDMRYHVHMRYGSGKHVTY